MAEIMRPSPVLLYYQPFDLKTISVNKRYKCYDEFKSFFSNFLVRTILPFMNFGQQVVSMPINRSIILQMVSLVFSLNVASGSINFLISGISLLLFVWDKKPKYRILIKPLAGHETENVRWTYRLQGSFLWFRCLIFDPGMLRKSSHSGALFPMRKPPTGEPCAGEPHARLGGRGGSFSLPDPYQRLESWQFDTWQVLHFTPVSEIDHNFRKQVIASRCPLIIVTLINGSSLLKYPQKIKKISRYMEVYIP
jgi:hypothetical protein